MLHQSLKSVFVSFLLLLIVAIVYFSQMVDAETAWAESAINHIDLQQDGLTQPDERLDTIIVDISVVPGSVHVGEPVTFWANLRNRPSPNDLEFTWSFGDGNTQVVDSNRTVQYTYSESASRTVTVIVDNGLEDSGSASLFVDVLPAFETPVPTPVPPKNPSIKIDQPKGPNGNYQVGRNVNFTMIAQLEEGTDLTYEWIIPFDSNPLPAGKLADRKIHQFATPGEYEITLNVWNSAGAGTASTIIEVLPERITGLGYRSPKVIQSGERIQFAVSVKTGSSVEYWFDFGDGTTSIGTTADGYSQASDAEPIFYSEPHLYNWREDGDNTELNEYNVKIKARNRATQNPAEITECIVIKPEPIRNLRIVSRESAPSILDPFDFVAVSNSGNIKEHKWKIINPVAASTGQNILSVESNFEHRFRLPGAYLMKVEVDGPPYKEKGCSDMGARINETKSATAIALVDTTPFFSDGIITVNAKRLTASSNRVQLELNKSATFEVNTLGFDDEEDVEYRWYFDTPLDEEQENKITTYEYSAEGEYLLTVLASNGQDEARAFYAVVTVTGQKTFLPMALRDSFIGQQVDRVLLTDTDSPAVTRPPEQPTNTSIPTQPPEPTATLTKVIVPTSTPTLTDTPMPTATATSPPTNTATPTATPTLTLVPTDVPVPVVSATPGTVLLPPTFEPAP